MSAKQITLGSEKFISRGDDSGTHKAEMRIWKDIKTILMVQKNSIVSRDRTRHGFL